MKHSKKRRIARLMKQGLSYERAFAEYHHERNSIKTTSSRKPKDRFLTSYEWRKVRMRALIRDGARCACCGSTPQNGARMDVDHIKPRRRFPELALDIDNLQVLCDECNHGKGNKTADFR